MRRNAIFFILLSMMLVCAVVRAQPGNPAANNRQARIQAVMPEGFFARERSIDENLLRNIETNLALDAKQRNAAPPRPLNPQSLLHGVNSLALTVLDGRTLRPVTEYLVHAEVVMDGMDINPGVPSIGRLESMRVRDAAGRGRYAGLGRLTVQLSIWAKGYLPKAVEARIPEGGPGIIVRLEAAGSIKGRVVDAASGAPLGGVRVDLGYTVKNRANHTREEYSAGTNTDGRFCIEYLPPDRYRPSLSERTYGLGELNRSAESRGELAARGKQGESGDETFRAAYRREVAKPGHVMPWLEPVELKSGAMLDLGTIRLERAPTLELEITYDGQVPLADYPFEVGYPKGLRFDIVSSGRFKTDRDGKARLTLAGWRPGRLAAVMVPSHYSAGACDLKKVAARLDGPQSSASERDWFQAIAASGVDLKLTENDVCDTRVLSQINAAMSERHSFSPLPDAPTGQISVNDQKLVDYDDLTPEARARFRAGLEDYKRAFRGTRGAGDASKPDHPNYEIFMPRAGEVSRVRIDLRPTTATIDLMLRFVDRQTSQPVARFRGAVAVGLSQVVSLMGRDFSTALETSGERIFRALDGSGQAVVPALVLPPELRNAEKELEQARRGSQKNSNLQYLENNASLGLVVDAPGYVRQTFKLTLAEARSGRELTFALEPAASVRGRVVLAATGQPLTSSTLLAALKFWGRLDEAILRGRGGLDNLKVEFANPTLVWERERSERGDSANNANARIVAETSVAIGPDGVFTIDGLRPHEDWRCLISLGLLPDYRREKIALQPGPNDLGEIRLGMPGLLSGKFVDEKGQGIEGAVLVFPAEQIGLHVSPTTQTRAGGGYRIDLLPFKKDRQLVRVVPPWGDDAETTTAPKMKVNVVHEKMMTFDRCGSNTLSGLLHRGNPLVLRLPPSARLAELERFYSVQDNWPVLGLVRGNNVVARPGFAICRIALQGLEAGPEGLTCAQLCELTGMGGRLSSATLELRLPRVPPGRYAVSVEGGLYDTAKPNNPAIEVENGIIETLPLAYAEFTMPPTSATLELAPAEPDVELTLDGMPPGIVPTEKVMGPLVFFEREGAVSTLHGSVVRRLLTLGILEARNRWGNLASEDFPTFPLPGFFAHFVKLDAAGREPVGWRPALLRAVPPGTYRLQAFSSPGVLMSGKGTPYFEDRVEVTSQTRRLTLTIPWRAPEK